MADGTAITFSFALIFTANGEVFSVDPVVLLCLLPLQCVIGTYWVGIRVFCLRFQFETSMQTS